MEYSKLIRYIKNETSPSETKEVVEWRKTPANELKYKEILDTWETSKKALQPNFTTDTTEAWEKIEQSLFNAQNKPKTHRLKKYYPKLAIAASLIFVLAIGWFVVQNNKKSIDNKDLITMNSGELNKKEVRLPDGTIIWLNKNSTIQYPQNFDNNLREVTLTGEAFFEVKRNTLRPFRVYTSNSVTEVLGTSFNINAFGKTTLAEVDVVTGKVAFCDIKNERKVILTKGEKGTLTITNELIKSNSDENRNFLAWKTGVLKFKGTPLQQVCKSLSEYYNKKIVLEDSTMNNIELSASFYEQSMEEVLNVINLTLDTEYTTNDTCIVLRNN